MGQSHPKNYFTFLCNNKWTKVLIKNRERQKKRKRDFNREEDFEKDPKKTGYLRNSGAVLNFPLRSFFFLSVLFVIDTKRQRETRNK